MTDEAVGSEVAVRDQSYVPAEGMDVERLMEVAIEKEGAIDVIKELVELRNAEMARQAERAMNDALHRFKAKCPPIPRAKAGAKLSNRDGSSRPGSSTPTSTPYKRSWTRSWRSAG
jgi:hypothetical protein